MASHIYEINPSVENARPFTVKSYLKVMSDDYERHMDVIHGQRPISKWSGIDFYCTDEGDATQWDYFMYPITFGLFSQRAIDALREALEVYFYMLPVTLENVAYFTLTCKERLDILDIERSAIRYFDIPGIDRANPKNEDIMGIDQYFFKGKQSLRDPVIFSIPQCRDFLFCTESVPRMARNAGLKGFHFQVVDSPKGSPKAIDGGWGGWEWNE